MKSVVFGALCLFAISHAASAKSLDECRKTVVGPYVSSQCRGGNVNANMAECRKRLAEQLRPQIQACVKGQ